MASDCCLACLSLLPYFASLPSFSWKYVLNKLLAQKSLTKQDSSLVAHKLYVNRHCLGEKKFFNVLPYVAQHGIPTRSPSGVWQILLRFSSSSKNLEDPKWRLH